MREKKAVGEKVRIKYSLVILSFICAACDSGFRPSDNFRGLSNRAFTGGTNDVGQRYTRFSGDNAIEKIQEDIKKDPVREPMAMVLAQNIESVSLKPNATSKSYDIAVKWRDQSNPQVFKGSSQASVGKPITLNTPTSPYHLELTCEADDCTNSVATIVDGDGIIGGFQFNRESKLLKTVESKDFNPNSLTPKARAVYENLKKGQAVEARSYNVAYGPSAVEILRPTENGLESIFETELFDTQGEILPVRKTAPYLSELGRTTMVGGKQKEVYIFQQDKGVGNTAGIEFALAVTDIHKAPAEKTRIEGSCPIADARPASPLAKLIIDEVIATCNQPLVAAKRKEWKGSDPLKVKNVISLYHRARQSVPTDNVFVNRMKVVLKEYNAQQFPDATLAIPAVETGFDYRKIGDAGEKGEAQITPCTGIDWGVVSTNIKFEPGKCNNNAIKNSLTMDKRLDPILGTRASLGLIKSHFQAWQYKDTNGKTVLNVPMSYYSYNRGLKGAKENAREGAETLKNQKDGRIYSYGSLNEHQLRLLSSDFFFLASIGSLHSGAMDYTLKVLSAFQIFLSPSDHGIAGAPAIAGN